MNKPTSSRNQERHQQPSSADASDAKPVATEKPPADAGAVIEVAPRRNKASCVVVGVGASAGGLEAFTELLRPLPKNPGMAFVLIPHLDPKHESAMTELLSRATAMQVAQVQDGMEVKPDCVYVIPPARSMTIENGLLRLVQREPDSRPSMPIDAFFRSLAADCGKKAVGVILSGTASDGTLGVAAIKCEGGITFAQDTHTAKYPGMPNSAVASGHVDFILPPDDIARELMRLRSHPYVKEDKEDEERKPQAAALEPGADMERIFRLLKQFRKVDFSDYKSATIRRRILRRMALARLEKLSDYVGRLEHNPKEVEALHHDILINVTSFFRYPEAFDALQDLVYPVILKDRQAADTIRVWVPGCSTGEEVYSHAIALLEYAGKFGADVSIQIFGTDLSDEAIRTARSGIYRESIAADVSPARLRRFFIKVENGYQISKSIRDICVFATQNVFNDPPFSRMDLVSCRNVLIYLSPVLQRRVLPIFHYALRPSGFLMVGNTEDLIGVGADLFEPADKRHKIYRKNQVPSPVVFAMAPEYFGRHGADIAPNHAPGLESETRTTPIELRREAERLLLTKYVPAAVVVNQHFDILQIHGRTNRYLELPSGKATLNLLRMIKPGLLFQLQNALEEARKNASPVRRDNLRLETDTGSTSVSVEVTPFQAPLHAQQSFIIVFEEGPPATRPEPPLRVPETADEKDRQIVLLKQELGATKEYLQSIIEALEASNQELQSANEEIQSGNEELQSTNEELQTSKEELESANEELNTVNEEMQHRNTELTRVNNDLLNLFASVSISIVMLDLDLSIRRITPPVEELLGITPADLGRNIRQIRLKSNVPDLERMMMDVIDDLQPREMEVWNWQNRAYRLRITPYRTAENRIEGVVLAFVDRAPPGRRTTSPATKQRDASRLGRKKK